MTTNVSFYIASLLKGKGFDNLCKYLWPFNGSDCIKMINKNSENFGFSAPTIAEVVMWLHEKHSIWIYADSHEFGKWCYYYRFDRPHESSSKITENGQFGLDDFNSPIEAYEAAIEYCLVNLIKEEKK